MQGRNTKTLVVFLHHSPHNATCSTGTAGDTYTAVGRGGNCCPIC